MGVGIVNGKVLAVGMSGVRCAHVCIASVREAAPWPRAPLLQYLLCCHITL